MRKFPWLVLITIPFLAALMVWTSFVIVYESEYVIITDFGRPVAIYNHERQNPGPHWKWPWQFARSIDRRLQIAEPPARELITNDKRNLDCAVYVLWRVNDPLLFVRSCGTFDVAQ